MAAIILTPITEHSKTIFFRALHTSCYLYTLQSLTSTLFPHFCCQSNPIFNSNCNMPDPVELQTHKQLARTASSTSHYSSHLFLVLQRISRTQPSEPTTTLLDCRHNNSSSYIWKSPSLRHCCDKLLAQNHLKSSRFNPFPSVTAAATQLRLHPS